MKNPSHPGPKFRTYLAVAAATALLFAGTAFAQVKIPSQSASSLEGEGGATGTTTTAPAASPTSPFSGNSSVSRVKVPTPTGGTGNVTVQTLPVPTTAPSTNVSAVQQVPLPRRDLDPATEKRLAELRRELGIANAALSSRLALPADQLFRDDAPTTLDELAIPSLNKVMEYIQLNDKKEITVQSFYNRAEGAKELGWARTLALVEWMTSGGAISIDDVKAAGPAPVLKPTPKPNSTEIGDTEYVNRIELLLE